MFSVGMSDVGRVREINEDCIFYSDKSVGVLPNLYILSDGMGGHKAGEIASNLAVNSFREYVINNDIKDKSEILDFLVSAVKNANKTVYEKSLSYENYEGMGATFSACTFFENKLYAVHVGDSRIYLINNSEINQLTLDHTYINEMIRTGKLSLEQAKNHPQKNIITRAVGISENIETDAFVEQLESDDLIMICSDGLTSMLDDREIFDLIKKNSEDKITPDGFSLEKTVSDCIEKANQKGGYDNISVILVSGVTK